MPERGQFTIQSDDPPLLFTGELGDDAPMPTDDSYGGWAITAIPKRMGLTEWGGRSPVGLSIDFVVDQLNSGNSTYVRHQFTQLEHLAGRNSEDDEPPICVVNGGGIIPHDVVRNPHQRWVVEGLTWDRTQTINGDDGNAVRIAGSISLRQYFADDVLGSYDGPAAKSRKNNKGKNKGAGKPKGDNKRRTYTVKSGDTLVSIASRVLHDSKRWRDIADLNKIRNPRGLKVGQVLRLPK